MRKVLMYFAFLFSIMVSAQENAISKDIQKAKNEGVQFQLVHNVLQKQNKTFLNKGEFDRPNEVNLVTYNHKFIPQDQNSIAISLPLNNQNVILDLIKVSPDFYDFDVTDEKGNSYPSFDSKVMHYRGNIRGDNNSLVAISFFEDDVMGIIANDEGNYNIGKIKGSNDVIIYNDSNLRNQKAFECGTVNDDFVGYNYEELFDQTDSNKQPGNKCVKLYFETEYDMFYDLGSVTNVRNYVTALFNQVAALYYNEDISVGISEIKVWTESDPYTATNTEVLLNQFQNHTPSFNGDLGQLLTFRITGGGRAAGFNGLCNGNAANRLSVAGFLFPFVEEIPLYSWSVMVVTHEFGHLFGSRHTHACVWNGNNTAIDGCADGVEGSCPIPGLPIGGGTIMSYCHQKTSVGINFNKGFGPQPGSLIRNRVSNASCLSACCMTDIIIPFPITSSTEVTASNQIIASSTISPNMNVDFTAPKIILKPGFKVSGNRSGKFKAIPGECSLSSKDNNLVSMDTVKEENDSLKVPILFPNPTSTILNIENIEDLNDWFLVDIYGSVVNQGKIKQNQSKITINTGGLRSGVYFFNATYKNGKLFQQTIMKK